MQVLVGDKSGVIPDNVAEMLTPGKKPLPKEVRTSKITKLQPLLYSILIISNTFLVYLKPLD